MDTMFTIGEFSGNPKNYLTEIQIPVEAEANSV